MLKAFKREFRLSGFGFGHNRPEEFALWSWQPTGKTNQCAISFYYATYRCLAAALFLSILVASGTTSESPTYWFIYLTDLGFLIQTLHLVTSAAVIVQQLVHYHTGGCRMTLLTKFSWFLYNTTNMTSVIITGVYWALLFTPGSPLGAIDFLVHGFNSITSIVDLFISKRPCRLLHFVHPLVVLMAYVAFSAIYWAAGGREPSGLSYIYPVLDWENLGLTVPFVAVGLFVGVPVVHTLFWGLHLLRDSCFTKCSTGSNQNSTNRQVEGRENPTFSDDRYL